MTTPQYPPPGSVPPGGYPPPPPQKKSKTLVIVLSVLGAFIVLCGFGGCIAAMSSNDADDKTATTTNAPAPASGEPAPAAEPPDSDIAPAGSAVRDGKFEFVVTAVDAPVKTVGTNPYLQKTAQGEYILVHVNVTNISDRPQTYFADNQKLIDDQGRKFDNDAMAAINVSPESSIGSPINPGNTMSVTIAFDVPPGTVPAVLEVHDSMFSGGAEVSLR
ncbi:DUF4352 domain-containing protein [Nocardia farcinica]|uniref:DUF4352 domain-containing protein n=1 Tax=Nocardia farcinica TaxID=37329 RepID=UPI0018955B95|nr:DUF4352 domain-containing protein [Nocardia farcinica]MBF6445728.1 DUF4352 domain-containing protein [Nocardia farcinica]